jgi:hypothetical protein
MRSTDRRAFQSPRFELYNAYALPTHVSHTIQEIVAAPTFAFGLALLFFYSGVDERTALHFLRRLKARTRLSFGRAASRGHAVGFA